MPKLKLKALIIEDDAHIVTSVGYTLKQKGIVSESAITQKEAYQKLKDSRFDFVILDLKLPVQQDDHNPKIKVGFDILAHIRNELTTKKLPVLAMTAYEQDIQTFLEVIKLVANSYIKKPFYQNQITLEQKIDEIVDFIKTNRGRVKPLVSKTIIGKNKKLLEAIRLARRAAKNKYAVLILGETGTGKELIAKEINRASGKKDSFLKAYNCNGIPAGTCEADLFGVSKGYATGVGERLGIFESADKGTVFLDEIADLPLDQQSKVLRILQERTVSRLGSTEPPKPVDFLLVTATNKDLLKEIEEKRFRLDLYERINTVFIELPPLRDRKEDIPLLIKHFKRIHRINKRLSEEAKKKLEEYDWPGNIRGLENIIKRANNNCTGRIILSEHIVFNP